MPPKACPMRAIRFWDFSTDWSWLSSALSSRRPAFTMRFIDAQDTSSPAVDTFGGGIELRVGASFEMLEYKYMAVDANLEVSSSFGVLRVCRAMRLTSSAMKFAFRCLHPRRNRLASTRKVSFELPFSARMNRSIFPRPVCSSHCDTSWTSPDIRVKLRRKSSLPAASSNCSSVLAASSAPALPSAPRTLVASSVAPDCPSDDAAESAIGKVLATRPWKCLTSMVRNSVCVFTRSASALRISGSPSSLATRAALASSLIRGCTCNDFWKKAILSSKRCSWLCAPLAAQTGRMVRHKRYR
mmetsp:Transcript_47680/g.132694  ORF Transcript_47680/g.132694 Transcript_47680/m.132694 type:complete len:299 (-) Transcript_47680:141-1037(-)